MKRKIVVCLMISFCLLLTGCKSTDYKNAVKAMNDKNYSEAIELFSNLGDYKDSNLLLTESIEQKKLYDTYTEALAFFDKGKRSEGIGKLKTLPESYLNSAELIKSYETPFNGEFVSYADPDLWGGKTFVNQKIVFQLTYSTVSKNFVLHAKKEVYYSDGDVFSSFSADLEPSEFIEGTISIKKDNGAILRWECSGKDATLVEYESSYPEFYTKIR